jgi:hypothetical protein
MVDVELLRWSAHVGKGSNRILRNSSIARQCSGSFGFHGKGGAQVITRRWEKVGQKVNEWSFDRARGQVGAQQHRK